jgi:hypothetical protein
MNINKNLADAAGAVAGAVVNTVQAAANSGEKRRRHAARAVIRVGD